MQLVIVESPSKAKTIEKYLKDLGDDFVVRASVGHIRDLPKSNKKAIDIKAGFVPHYEISQGKEKVISELKKLAKKADKVYLAPDPDREGEAIAWHLKEVLDLPDDKIARVTFNEITKQAVKEAFGHPQKINMQLKEAQEARRVLDRLVGYDLSGLIWKKVRYGLSAGRVQSPALRILMEREREIKNFKPEQFWQIKAVTETQNKDLLELKYYKDVTDQALLKKMVKEAKKHQWKVFEVKEHISKRSARPPFTTSTLQQVASTRLGFSPANTMRIAQKLYESGLITYMRTDSVNLSAEATGAILNKIEKTYGKEYAQKRIFKSKSKNAQEAHEAIRPTNPDIETAGKTADERKLYKLIWQRALASQAKDAELLKMKIEAGPDTADKCKFIANGSRVKFDGWLKIDPQSAGEETILPKVAKDETLILKDLETVEKWTEPPNRFTEAGLVKELEKRGIGRPSTYASILKTLQDRGYVTKQGRTLFPTDTGDVVSSFLEKNFMKYISDTFTAEMENELDEIATGKRKYTPTLSAFYKEFKKDIDSKADIDKITSMGDAPSDYKCPICSGPMEYKLAKNGKFMSCKKFPECLGARKADGSIIEPPKELGEKCPECQNGTLVEKEGKYGRFVCCSNYPKCKYVKNDPSQNSTGVKCPECEKKGKDGEMVEKRGRFGPFYACSNYPDCKLTTKAKPTGNRCPLCNSLMMEGTKTIPERCSDKECPNHNPHKLKS